MGRARKAQRQRDLERGLAKVVRYNDALDDPGHFDNATPLYGDDLLPWEQPIAGFEMAHDRGPADDLWPTISRALTSDDRLDAQAHPFQSLMPETPLTGTLRSDNDDQDFYQEIWRSSGRHIPLGDGQIRVFELAPGVADDPLCGTFIPTVLQTDSSMLDLQADPHQGPSSINYGIRADLKRKVQYTAISYCWGPGNGPQRQLLISGHVLAMSTVVATLLRAIRHPQYAVRLWLDQICIDQDSREDKEDQIELMSLIYRRAYNTLIWLGDSPEDGAFHLLQSLAYNFWGVREDNNQWKSNLAPLIAHRKKALHSLMKLFQSTWFTRTWIVQELALSWRPYIWYGSRTMSWNNFSTAALYLEDFDVSMLSDLDEHQKLLSKRGIKNMRQLDAIRLQCLVSDPDALRLHSLLRDTRSADVTLPVDKVYGIMALCDEIVPVDYTAPTAGVFEATTAEIIRQTSLADVLSDVDHDCDECEDPSWVVNWSKKRRTTPLHTSLHRAHQRAGSSLAVVGTKPSPKARILTMKALIIDALEDLSETVQDAQLTNIDPGQFNIAFRHLIEFVSKCQSTRQQQVDFGTFCATIVAGQNETGLEAFPERYLEVLSLLCDETTGQSPSLPGQTYSMRQQKGHLTLDSLFHRQPKKTLQELRASFSNAMLNRRLARSMQGYIVLVPSFARGGDTIWVLIGCSMPCVLRKRGHWRYALVGECYLHHLMDGKYFKEHVDDLIDVEIA